MNCIEMKCKKLLKMKGRETMKGTSCEECAYFEYDEDEESYGCQFFFDEDDIAKASLYGDRYICLIFNIEMNTEL